ncbi:MAG: UvrD-helicase domain-containing protein [Betaproteobacteria bacterium]
MTAAARDPEAHLAEDGSARERALDVTRSFLVQAPAGSGKTELLTQRYLALLARVERPERVLAITFTRKAAGEMRERVVRALVAAQGDDDAGLAPHARTTRRLARAVLAHDRALGWSLIAHPSRLAIRTIDALAQAIALQAPIASGLPPSPRFTEDPGPLYVEAVRAAIADADERDPAWRSLLDHQDNDADALGAFLAAMLAQRDRWFTLLGGDPARLRARLEESLAREVKGELEALAGTLRRADLAPLCGFAALASRHLSDDNAALREVLAGCASRGAPPPLDFEHVDAWKAIARWLSTQQGDLRKTARGMAGIPPVGGGDGRNERSEQAQAVGGWLKALADDPEFEEALRALSMLPPTRYDEEEWSRIASLLSLLPALAARLATVFGDAREYDFVQGTLAALAALGTGDAPSELLLRLDLSVDHILVDEFQDTSYAHLDLLGRLMAGWSDGDGRTLFAVGDPMQSIYGFRGADVRAFVEAQSARTIEGVAIETLRLRRNFRSQAGLVEWVNRTFPDALGATSDPWRGRVAFAEAVAVLPRSSHEPCTVDHAESADEEAALVVARVRESLEEGGDVAVLVRSRSHLATILPALREAGIPYEAVELDVLADRPAVRDVVALAHALLQPDDRLAWLAVLRAPWCGLLLADLHAIVRAADGAKRSIEAIVHAPPSSVDEDARARLARIAAVLERAHRDADRATLAERLHDAWLALGGPATLDDPIDLVAVEDVIALVAGHERAGGIDDWSAFEARLAGERLSPRPGEPARVQVMTMHKAKGLEFDAVILPALASGHGRRDTPLLRWRTRRTGLLVGLAAAQGGEHGGVDAYLKALHDKEERAELARLAYVACTRPRRRLALVASVRARDNPKTGAREWVLPSDASLFAVLGAPGFATLPPPDAEQAVGVPPTAAPALERLPSDWSGPPPRVPLAHPLPARAVEPSVRFEWARERTRRLGVVVHGLLAQIAADGIGAWNARRITAQADRIVAELVGEGALPADAAREADDVSATVEAVLRDERGRWLLAEHEHARSEWALVGIDGDETVRIVVDRTFVAEGTRWIVDFKTGAHEGANVDAFLASEAERYRPQLSRYARIVAAIDPSHPIRLALYHPRVPGGWREVEG